MSQSAPIALATDNDGTLRSGERERGSSDAITGRDSDVVIAASGDLIRASGALICKSADESRANSEHRLSGRESCAAFVDAYYQRVFAWFFWLIGRREAAGDLTQETFTAFWGSLRRTRVREPGVWLFRIARNQWRKHCRDGKRERAAKVESSRRPGADNAIELVARANPGPAQTASDAERVGALLRLLDRLPARCREAVVLRYWSDLSYGEIAAIQRVPGPLARWRVHHGRKLLRGWMEPGEGAPAR